MSLKTGIQWCDSTQNPVMGCDGCPLFPPPGLVAEKAIQKVEGSFPKGMASTVIREQFRGLRMTDLFQRRAEIANSVAAELSVYNPQDSPAARREVENEISSAVRCYAATLHLRWGGDSRRPDKRLNPGYAPSFEAVTCFPGRMETTAASKDLHGTERPDKPWLNGFPRLVFVSDMGDALSTDVPFDYLKKEIVDVARSPNGKAHVWLWLTKQPQRMAEFSDWLEKQDETWPENLVPMASVIDQKMVVKVKHLNRIPAKLRGLSVEPLWEGVDINLEGIDWVIVGGESGGHAKPFDLAWARSLRDQCKREGKSFFLKQLGFRPIENGNELSLKDQHGGEWDEWPEDLRTREVPMGFRELTVPRATSTTADAGVIVADRDDFKRLNDIVLKGVSAFMEAGEALSEIRDRELWKAGHYASWDAYCREVIGMSKVDANRLVRTSEIGRGLRGVEPNGSTPALPVPRSESQVRPMIRLQEPSLQQQAWALAVKKACGQPTAAQVASAVIEIESPAAVTTSATTSRRAKRQLLAARLRQLLKKRDSWDELESIAMEFEELV